MISSVGTNKNARRTALVHLSFNIIGTVVWLTVFWIVKATLAPALFSEAATLSGIAVAHSVFNLACTLLLLPMSGLLEKLAYKLIPETKQPDAVSELDERLLATPAIALERCGELTLTMAGVAAKSLKASISCLRSYDSKLAESIREAEDKTDHYEDIIGSYLVKLSTYSLNEKEGAKASMLLKAIGDFERIGDHAVNILESAEELRDKGIEFSSSAKAELFNLCSATEEITDLSHKAFSEQDDSVAALVEPLEQVIDRLKEELRSGHIERLRLGECGIEAGFIWSDLITNMERVADHCSNIAGCMVDAKDQNMNLHLSLNQVRNESSLFREKYEEYSKKYLSH